MKKDASTRALGLVRTWITNSTVATTTGIHHHHTNCCMNMISPVAITPTRNSP